MKRAPHKATPKRERRTRRPAAIRERRRSGAKKAAAATGRQREKKERMEQEQATTEYALSLIAAGDPAGCDLLYGQLGGAMLAAARAVTGDRAAAEDAVQDAFIRIVRGIRGYRPGTNPRAWVLRIVRNCAIAKIDRHRAANIDEFYNLADGQDCEERACDRLLAESLLQNLTSVQRKVIYLKYFMDMTVREIAKEVGKSKSYVQKEIGRSEQKMRQMLQSRGQNGDADG